MTQEEIAKRAGEIIAGLCEIPVQELIDCARGNLTATRRIRLGKDPDGVEEPDFTVRQKAVEWIGAVIGVSVTGARKPIEKPAEATKADGRAVGRIKPLPKADFPHALG